MKELSFMTRINGAGLDDNCVIYLFIITAMDRIYLIVINPQIPCN